MMFKSAAADYRSFSFSSLLAVAEKINQVAILHISVTSYSTLSASRWLISVNM